MVAIESRDPTTAGHSGRVATLTVGLAAALEHETAGPYAGVRFDAPGRPGDPLRLAAARLRQGGRARARAGEGREALPARARGPPGPLRAGAQGPAAPERCSAGSTPRGREAFPALEREELDRLDGRARTSSTTARVHPRVQPAHRARPGRLRAADRAGAAHFRDARDAEQPLLLAARGASCCPSPAARSRPRSAWRSRATSPTPSASSRRSPGPGRCSACPRSPTPTTRSSNGTGYPRAIPARPSRCSRR